MYRFELTDEIGHEKEIKLAAVMHVTDFIALRHEFDKGGSRLEFLVRAAVVVSPQERRGNSAKFKRVRFAICYAYFSHVACNKVIAAN